MHEEQRQRHREVEGTCTHTVLAHTLSYTSLPILNAVQETACGEAHWLQQASKRRLLI